MKRGKILLAICLVLILCSFTVFAVCEDADGDGYGVGDLTGCTDVTQEDCNDNDPDIYPGATEIANGLDDDCNGLIDDGVVLQCVDTDLDGYNATEDDSIFCPGGDCCSTPENLDCDDSQALVNPGLEEICGDGLDNDCDASTPDECPIGEGAEYEGFPEGCEILSEHVYWSDCEGNEVTTVNEGDSVYLIATTDMCHEDSLIDFTIKEDDTDGDIATLTEEYFLQIEDTSIKAWAAGWIAAWLDDGTVEPDPDYFFTAKVMTPDEGNFESESPLLVVEPCPPEDPDCGVECTLEGGFVAIGGRSARSSGGVVLSEGDCIPQWDCSAAKWDCDSSTGKATRDISSCVFIGLGDELCMENSRATLQAEKACASSEVKQKASSYTRGGPVGEEEEEEVEEGGFPWLLLLIVGLVLILVVGGVLYYLKLRKGTGKKPFASEKDLKAVTDYIGIARSKGATDVQVKDLLKKSGWTDAQVNYAFKKAAVKAKPAVKK